MKVGMWFVLSMALMLGGVSFVIAEDKPVEPPKTEKKEMKKAKKIHINKPFGMLTSLTEEQKEKINAIEEAAKKQVDEIKAKEEADIRALLTDAQKKELEDLQAKAEAEKKAPKADKKKETEKAPEKKEEPKATK